MSKTEQIFWMTTPLMKKFHAFPLDSSVSLCGKWFVAGACNADDWNEKYGENSKCLTCQTKTQIGVS